MLIRAGYDITYDCPHPVPAVFLLNVHHSRLDDIVAETPLTCVPAAPVRTYFDGFGNRCSRVLLPAGRTTLTARLDVRDSGLPDEMNPDAVQHEVSELPEDVLVYLLASRYCDTDLLSSFAWSRFGHIPPGWAAAGDLRFRPPAHPLQLSVGEFGPHRLGRAGRRGRRLPRLCPSRRGALPLHEHSCALLHGLSR